jgi:hypothetical protein
MEAYRLRGAVRVAILQGGEDLRVMRAILAAAIFRERLVLELDPGAKDIAALTRDGKKGAKEKPVKSGEDDRDRDR